ncbi:MAG: NAD-dependent epimerase/dehydratase family protein [Myxococcota bacterium]
MADKLSPVCVTGASGFVGSYVVQELLGRGYEVRATVRDPEDRTKTAHLRAMGDVQLLRGDLLEPGSFDAAVEGCKAVVHVASTVQLTAKDPQREIVDVAVRGTRNVLESAQRAGSVRRVVQTSSVAAIIDPQKPEGHVFTECDWNESAGLSDSPYDVSKREAERAAVAFRDALPEDARFELTAIHPSFVLGPVLTKAHLKSSPSMIRTLLKRQYPACPNLSFAIVDVRDVAAAHAQALEVERPSPRHIVASESLFMPEIARILKQHFPDSRVPTAKMPDLFMYLAPFFDKRASFGFVRRNLGKKRLLSNELARTELGLEIRPAEPSIVDCARSILEAGWA